MRLDLIIAFINVANVRRSVKCERHPNFRDETMKPQKRFNSHQEAMIENFMQKSFGANSLFTPDEYRKGSATREPADLAWHIDDFVSLIYMKSGKSSLKKQIMGNKKQFIGYLGKWKSNDPLYTLKGTNRFGDNIALPYADVRVIVGILVVSAPCGCQVKIVPLEEKIAIEIVIPESLFNVIANSRGTMIDLLNIVLVTYPLFVPLTNDASEYELLHAYESYRQASIGSVLSKGDAFHPKNALSTEKLFDDLSHMRMSGDSGRAMQDHEGRAMASRIFADMSIKDYGALIQGVHTALESSGPNFERWCIAVVDSYYKFVLVTVNMGNTNVDEIMNKVLSCEQALDSDGVDRSVMIQYHKLGDWNDIRKPAMFGFAAEKKQSQASSIINRIYDELNGR